MMLTRRLKSSHHSNAAYILMYGLTYLGHLQAELKTRAEALVLPVAYAHRNTLNIHA